MSNMSLEDLRNQAVIDTTKGKIDKPIEGTIVKTLAETDPAFIPSGQSIPGGPKRTPVIEGNPPKPLSVVNARFDPDSATPFDVNTLEKKPEPKNELEEDLMSDLDKAVEAEKKSISERIQAITEKQYEEFIEGKVAGTKAIIDDEDITEDIVDDITVDTEEEDEEVIRPTVTRTIKAPEPTAMEIEENIEEDSADDIDPDADINLDDTTNKKSDTNVVSISSFDDLDDDLDKESGDGPDTEKIFDEFKNDIKKITKPIKNIINLEDFTISGTKVSPATLHLSISDVSVADHFLPNSDRIITCSALSGPEMLKMNPENSNRSRINMLRDIYSIIYRHVLSKKPEFDDWMKVVPFSDLDHIYFALYKATFGGSNFVHYECTNPECGNVFIHDIPFDDFIKYDNDEVKEKMQEIVRKADGTNPTMEVSLHQISDNIVIGLRNPSIWNVVIEMATLSDKFLEKYEELIDVISYIDSVYVINFEKGSLDPIDMKPDKSSLAKTVTRRIKIIYSILRNLPSDNYYELRGKIGTSYPNISAVTYRIPETKCPKCGAVIPEMEIGAQQLLFMRHQLGALGAL